jgi:hypothetical protein
MDVSLKEGLKVKQEGSDSGSLAIYFAIYFSVCFAIFYSGTRKKETGIW